MTKLSERFAKLQPTNNGGAKAETSRKGRVQARAGEQKDSRRAKTDAKRGLAPREDKPAAGKKGKNDNKTGGRLNKPKVNAANNKKPAGKKGRKPQQKKEKKSAEDLDMDMDDYWHKAGKGPDPRLSALDRELEEYNQSKSAGAADAAEPEKMDQ